MKITQRQLKRIIREEISKLKKATLLESNSATAELTDPGVTRDDIYNAWPEGVTHNGQNVYELYYSDQVMSDIWRMLRNSAYEDGQEVYLGYSPRSDKFFMGFDVFESYEDEWGDIHGGDEMSAVVVALYPGGEIDDIVIEAPGTMYPSGLRELKQHHPDIIDVRLD